MKRILGLDLGTTSIGWALINEANEKSESSSIIKTGVRLVPLTVDEETNFAKGKSITTNADRTLKRGARRSLQRYKQRREHLTKLLIEKGIISSETIIAEEGKNTTFELWSLRSKAATEKISLENFARVLFSINKKRGYKSNRKAKDENDGSAIDGMAIAKELFEKKLTPGQYSLQLISEGKKKLPDFYRSDLRDEFDRIWKTQSTYYPEQLTEDLKHGLEGKNSNETWKICESPFGIEGIILKGTKTEIQEKKYELRSSALKEKVELEELAIVLQEINGQINGSSSYLGEISDRSKELYFNSQTIGQYLFNQLKGNPHSRLKNQVFYRQDYVDEFEKIWELQSNHHKELNDELKNEIRDVIIFYQRKLKSQKGLIGFCEFESKEIELKDNEGNPVLRGDGKPKKVRIGSKSCPKSSPIFQDFKIWQLLNNLEFRNKETRKKEKIQDIDEDLEIRNQLFSELSIHGSRTATQILKIVFAKPNDWELNYKDGLDGNHTVESIYKAFQKIAEDTGHDINFRDDASKIQKNTYDLFSFLNLNPEVLMFDEVSETKDYQQLPSFQLWHLLYSYEGDDSNSGNELLERLLQEKFGFSAEQVKILSQIAFKDDYGSLSTKAMLKILPFLKQGMRYNDACTEAGYNHSHSLTKEENDKRLLKDALELLPKNSLRNPVVEKILNQLVNVVNAIIKEYGKPEEIRIELARDLKKSAKERAKATTEIAAATRKHEEYKLELKKLYPFSAGVRITKKDIIKYKLYLELKENGHKTIYTNTYVPLEKLFTKDFDIEHIIPKARVFDDSFSNKTLATRQFNLDKADETGIDFMQTKFGENSNEFQTYVSTIESLYKKKVISKAKYNKLLTPKDKIKDGFIERDLRNSQYIAKKAREMLLEVVRNVTPTTGKITDKLREDWQLIDVMKELNLPKYEALDMIDIEETKDGKKIKKIRDWTKRNDHRHHAMDAIAIAYCKHNHVQYYNYLNARRDENHKEHANIIAIGNKETKENEKGKRVMIPPMPLVEFRKEVKQHLEQTLISFKAKNKVVTWNKNKIKKEKGTAFQRILTPRGQLHKEMVYGKSKVRVTKLEKVNASFDESKIETVSKKVVRAALLKRLAEFGHDPKKAFTGKNALVKNSIQIGNTDEYITDKVEIVNWEYQFTIRKAINSDNFKNEKSIDKVVDLEVREILKQRLYTFNNDAKKAFSDLDKTPIWFNEKAGIKLKRVTITGVSNAEALHTKKDHIGNELLNAKGEAIPVDFVSTGSNHHLALYQNAEGDIIDVVTSFTNAVKRSTYGVSIIPKDTSKFLDEVLANGIEDESFLLSCPPPGYSLVQSFKQNEMFLFPHPDWNGLNPIDFNNYNVLSKYLFRVQKFSKLTYGKSAVRDYVFRHHLETQLLDNKSLKDVAFRSVKSIRGIIGLTKVRINHLGNIVHIGEY